MQFRVLTLTKEIEKAPSIALSRFKGAMAIHANYNVAKRLDRAAGGSVLIKKSPIVHNEKYVLIEIEESSGALR